MSDGLDPPSPWFAEAIRATGVEASSAAPLVGPNAWSSTPRSYLVSVRDGRRVKVRLARREDLAARAAALSGALADRRVPPPLLRVGRVTVERWIEGTPLSALRLRGECVDLAADLLACVHRFGGVAPERLPRVQRVGPLARRAEQQLAELAAAGRVGQSEARALRTILHKGLPDTARWGLTHGDFCAANLVRRPDGRLVSVDNELIGRGFLDYDLARAWYRWPMPPWALERFERMYRATTGTPQPAPREEQAWRVAAALKGLHLRHRRGVPSARAQEALGLLLEG